MFVAHRIGLGSAVGIVVLALSTVVVAAPSSAAAHQLRAVGAASLPTLATDDDRVLETTLRELATTQTAADVQRVLDTGLPSATLMDPTNSRYVAAVVMTRGLRALTPVGPGCSGDSLCMQTSAGIPYGYTGTGSRSGTWKDIKRASANGRAARFVWTGGSVNVAKGITNVFGAPVTMTQVSR